MNIKDKAQSQFSQQLVRNGARNLKSYYILLTIAEAFKEPNPQTLDQHWKVQSLSEDGFSCLDKLDLLTSKS